MTPDAGGEHHAAKQLRDYHGRWAKIGARIQGKGGNLGWVKGQDADGNAVITTDAGTEVTINPDDMKVVSVEGRATLADPPTLVDDIAARVEAYEAWAAEQMGGEG